MKTYLIILVFVPLGMLAGQWLFDLSARQAPAVASSTAIFDSLPLAPKFDPRGIWFHQNENPELRGRDYRVDLVTGEMMDNNGKALGKNPQVVGLWEIVKERCPKGVSP